MPTYTNNTAATITEKVRNTSGIDITFVIEPGKTLETEFILQNAGLTEDDAAPFYNPLISAGAAITSTGPGDDQTVSIDLKTRVISILNQSDQIVSVYLCSKFNTPPLKVFPSTERLIDVGGNVDQIICEFPDAASVYVEERR